MLDINTKIETVSDLVWADENQTTILANVKFSHLHFVIPFQCGANYDYQHGIDFYNNAIAGEYGPIGDYVAPETEGA